MLLAVCGLHMRDCKLNGQLVSRGAVFVRETTTAPRYTMHALHDMDAPIVKPALVYHPRTESGVTTGAVTVEVWEVPVQQVGSLLQLVSAPLALGTVHLTDGSSVVGYVAEGWAADADATAVMGIRSENITEFGGWRQWQASLKK